jgi:hypothetical protein
MKQKTSDISTVVVINKNQQPTRSLQIKTKHLNNLKHYAFGTLSVVLVLVISIFYCKMAKPCSRKLKSWQLMAQIVNLKAPCR